MVNSIVFVCPSLGGGGAERVSVALSKYFFEHGVEFTFLLTKRRKICYPIPKGVRVITEHADPDMSPLRQIYLIRSYMKNNRDSVFISFLPHQNMYTLLASIGMSNKVIISIRNDPGHDFPSSKLLPHVRDILYMFADSIVFQTDVQRDSLPFYLQEKGPTILNPVSDGLPMPFQGGRRKVIVTSGRLEEQKNHAMTIRAFAQFHESHSDYSLEIFGEGSLEDELKNLAKELGVGGCVSFEGFSSHALEHVRTASAFVMSSRFEGLSNSMLEALAMGVPTVCTRCLGGGAEAVIEDGVNGLLVDVDDVDGEVQALCRLVDDVHFSQEISVQSQVLREKLSLKSVGDAWRRLVS